MLVAKKGKSSIMLDSQRENIKQPKVTSRKWLCVSKGAWVFSLFQPKMILVAVKGWMKCLTLPGMSPYNVTEKERRRRAWPQPTAGLTDPKRRGRGVL